MGEFFFKLLHEKVSSIWDLLTAIQESWNYLDKEYCFKLEKSLPERNEAVINTEEEQLSIDSNVFVNEFHNFFLNIGLYYNIFTVSYGKNNQVFVWIYILFLYPVIVVLKLNVNHYLYQG